MNLNEYPIGNGKSTEQIKETGYIAKNQTEDFLYFLLGLNTKRLKPNVTEVREFQPFSYITKPEALYRQHTGSNPHTVTKALL